MTAVRDLATLHRFLALLASRHDELLNTTALAGPLGVLETTAQILVIPPFYENLGKRLVKSPRVYLADSGLACHLLGIESAAEPARSPFPLRRPRARLRGPARDRAGSAQEEP